LLTSQVVKQEPPLPSFSLNGVSLAQLECLSLALMQKGSCWNRPKPLLPLLHLLCATKEELMAIACAVASSFQECPRPYRLQRGEPICLVADQVFPSECDAPQKMGLGHLPCLKCSRNLQCTKHYFQAT
jgi:hypothetical protein